MTIKTYSTLLKEQTESRQDKSLKIPKKTFENDVILFLFLSMEIFYKKQKIYTIGR